MINRELFNKVELLHDTLRSVATNDQCEIGDYEALRSELMANPITFPLLPEFVKKYRKVPFFWDFIKAKFAHYTERRLFLQDSFQPLYDLLEKPGVASDGTITEIISSFSESLVQDLWIKALDRRDKDPEGAITAARSLLEATCKHILGKMEKSFSETDELPKLFNTLSNEMNLAPSQHTEPQFRQILGGAYSIVNGLASVRNKLSDAHGGGLAEARPSPRHATLCVNIAGTITSFLLETYMEKFQSK